MITMSEDNKLSVEIQHDPEACRFFTVVDCVTAFAKYLVNEGTIDIRHTIVPKEIGGRGIASKLVAAVYKWGDEQNLEPRASCSYAAVWCKRHGIDLPQDEGEEQVSCAL